MFTNGEMFTNNFTSGEIFASGEMFTSGGLFANGGNRSGECRSGLPCILFCGAPRVLTIQSGAHHEVR